MSVTSTRSAGGPIRRPSRAICGGATRRSGPSGPHEDLLAVVLASSTTTSAGSASRPVGRVCPRRVGRDPAGQGRAGPARAGRRLGGRRPQRHVRRTRGSKPTRRTCGRAPARRGTSPAGRCRGTPSTRLTRNSPRTARSGRSVRSTLWVRSRADRTAAVAPYDATGEACRRRRSERATVITRTGENRPVFRFRTFRASPRGPGPQQEVQ
jgi:hypothetical protein